MKKILITGANSYIGLSFEKYIGDNFSDEFTVDTVDMIGDGWKDADFSEYDAVFHVAGIAHIKETKENTELYFKVNRDLAIDVAKKAKADGVGQFVFLSSMSVYGLEKGVITADTLPKPKTNYGKAKLQAEVGISELSDDNFKVAILRPPMVYGKGCKGNYQSLRKLALKLPFFPYVKNRRSMIYIDNLCEFVRAVIADGSGGLFFPQNAEYVNTSDMAKQIRLANGKKPHIVKGFGWLVRFFGLFVKKIRKAFGSLTYDKEMSKYTYSYNIKSFDLSLKCSEDISQ